MKPVDIPMPVFYRQTAAGLEPVFPPPDLPGFYLLLHPTGAVTWIARDSDGNDVTLDDVAAAYPSILDPQPNQETPTP